MVLVQIVIGLKEIVGRDIPQGSRAGIIGGETQGTGQLPAATVYLGKFRSRL